MEQAAAMSAQAWVAFGALLVVIIVQACTFAFMLGGLFSRVKWLENVSQAS